MYTKESSTSSSFFKTSVISLQTFISELDELLENQGLQIINGPDLNRNNLAAVQKTIIEVQDFIQNYDRLGSTTKGIMHLSPTSNLYLTTDEVREYYKQLAGISLKNKKCTCVNLTAVTLILGEQLLSKYPESKISIDLCQLANWSHGLMRLRQTDSQGNIESLFYDPWYQRCYTNDPHTPKIFAEETLAQEISCLRKLTNMIRPTEMLHDFENDKFLINTQRDYALHVLCSTDEFDNPATAIPDPSVSYESGCTLF